MQQHHNQHVLVVGAGPTGLVAASVLAAKGVKVSIFDQNTTSSIYSKALGIQAGTLEALENYFGSKLVNDIIQNGLKLFKGYLHLYGLQPIELPLNQIPGRYHYVLSLEQSNTEKILENHLNQLGVEVQRSHQVLGVKQGTHHVNIDYMDVNGKKKSQQFAYVIACDGASSTIRKALGFQFSGHTYEGQFSMGDVRIRWPLETKSPHIFITDQGVMACFPLPTKHNHRLIIMQNSVAHSEKELTLKRLHHMAKSIYPSIDISKPEWITQFRMHHRMTKQFRQGRVFLAGDAAHIHSPIGGQGMNTGLQDAINIGDKVSKVLQQNRPVSILSQYAQERIPVAEKILYWTDKAFKTIAMPNSMLKKIIFTKLVPFLIRFPITRRIILRSLSEVDIARKEIKVRQS